MTKEGIILKANQAEEKKKQKLRDWCITNNVSQSELVDLTGISRSTLWRLLTTPGANISLSKWERLELIIKKT